MPRRAVAARDGGLDGDALAGQGPLDHRAAGLVEGIARHRPHRSADDLGQRDAEPFLVMAVGEAVDVVEVQLGDQHRQRIGETAQLGLALGQGLFGGMAAGIVQHGAHHAADPAFRLVDRRVEQVEDDLLVHPVAAQRHRLLAIGHHLAAQAALQDGAVPVPDLRPDLGHGAAQGARMVAAGDRAIAVIVDHDVVMTPHQHLGHRRVDDVGDRRAQRRRPARDRPQRGAGPVPLPHQRAAFATARRPGRGLRHRSRVLPPQSAEGGAHHVLGRAVPARSQAVADELLEIGRQGDVSELAGGHNPPMP